MKRPATQSKEQKKSGTSSAYPLIGAHVNGGVKGAVKKALEIGAQSMQIFIGSPQTWHAPVPDPSDVKTFIAGVKNNNLGPVFVHGNYLVNLATPNSDNLKKSLYNTHEALRMADMVGAHGLIFHPGSARTDSHDEAMVRLFAAIQIVLRGYEGRCKLLLEVCAGQGGTIGNNFWHLKEIIGALGNDERLGVCWDTCHLFNAGYDVSSEAGLAKTIDEFETIVGFEWLYAVHANDSKTTLGARRDRHENIGKGYIGEDAFRRMLNHPKLRPLPWILEVPGMENKGPDRANIDILHRLATG